MTTKVFTFPPLYIDKPYRDELIVLIKDFITEEEKLCREVQKFDRAPPPFTTLSDYFRFGGGVSLAVKEIPGELSELLGFVSKYHTDDSTVIDTLYVKPSARRSGVASLLMQIALKNTREYVDINVLSCNTAAKELYKKFGFNPLVETLSLKAKKDDSVFPGHDAAE